MKKILKKLLQLSLCLGLINTTSCITYNCYKIGYSQEVESTFFDETNNKGYFVYSFLEKKGFKNYSLYSIDTKGKYEKILDLGTNNNNIDYNNSLNYNTDHKIINNNKLLFSTTFKLKVPTLEENAEKLFYLIDLNSNNVIYKKNNIVGRFNKDNTKTVNTEKNNITVFDLEKENSFSLDDNMSENTRTDYKWIDSFSFIAIKEKKENGNTSMILSLYQINNDSISKKLEYKIKDSENKIFNSVSFIPKNLTDNILYFESYVIKDENSKNISSDSFNYNSYKLDFLKNELLLDKKDIEKPKNNINEKILLKASEKMYLYYLDKKAPDNKVPILDYMKSLPKSYYNEETICGNNFGTMDKLQRN